MAPGSPLKIVVLWGDRSKGEYAMLLKMPAGFVAPIHAHTGDYHGMNLTGSWRHSFEGGEQKDLPPGSYVFQPGMGMHGDACVGSEDCILFIHQHVKGDFIPKQ
jgi:gentisate 1,2-dioxygenase